MERNKVERGALILAAVGTLGLACASGLTRAGTPEYYIGKAQGWWWGKVERLPSVPAPIPEVPPAAAGTPTLKPLSPAWLREKLPVLRDRALEEPSPENVRAYFALQRYAMDVSERFATVAQQVILTDPVLDENNRRPLSSYGAQVFDEVARAATERLAAKVASVAGIFFFYRHDCPYCAAEAPILERLQKRIGLTVLPIALDGLALPEGHFPKFIQDKGQARSLNVTKTPTLYLVGAPDHIILLTEGLSSDEELLERMVIAGHEAGWLSDGELEETRPFRSTLPAVDPALVTDELLNDPVRLVTVLEQTPPGSSVQR